MRAVDEHAVVGTARGILGDISRALVKQPGSDDRARVKSRLRQHARQTVRHDELDLLFIQCDVEDTDVIEGTVEGSHDPAEIRDKEGRVCRGHQGLAADERVEVAVDVKRHPVS